MGSVIRIFFKKGNIYNIHVYMYIDTCMYINRYVQIERREYYMYIRVSVL